jgi:predicted CXXCH cytochrome family protein
LVWVALAVVVLTQVLGSVASPAFGAPPASEIAAGRDAGAEDYAGSRACLDCHIAEFEQFKKTRMSVLLTDRYQVEQRGCEACHGPGMAHVSAEIAGEQNAASLIYSFARHSAKENSRQCLACHQKDGGQNLLHRSRHLAAGIGCNACHDPHRLNADDAIAMPAAARQGALSAPNNRAERQWLRDRLLRGAQPDLCYSCHKDVASQFQLPVRHPVDEGAVKCTDCHSPHGAQSARELRRSSVEQACYGCHAEKRGPFAYEHAPVRVEGCTSCHVPHGSTNPRLLTRRFERQICLECHVSRQTGSVSHAQGSFQAAADCTSCHAEIHGSNYQRDLLR